MWLLMPSRPSSKTWNRPAGPAPTIRASVSTGVTGVLGSVKGGTSGKTPPILADRRSGPTHGMPRPPPFHPCFPRRLRKLRLETTAQLRQILILDAYQGRMAGQAAGSTPLHAVQERR